MANPPLRFIRYNRIFIKDFVLPHFTVPEKGAAIAGKARFNVSGRQVLVQPFSKPLRCNGFQKDLVFQFQENRQVL